MGRRRTIPVTTVGQFWDALVADYGVAGSYGLVVEDILVDTGTTLPALLETIDNFLDTEIAAILVDTGTTIPGLLATIAGYIDTEIATLLEYEVFKITFAAMAGVTPAGTITTNPEQTFNASIGAIAQPAGVNQYGDLDLGVLCRIIDYRIYWDDGNTNTNGRWKISYQDEFGDWNDLVTAIPSGLTSSWTDWADFPSFPEAQNLRFTVTTYDVNSRNVREVQVRGVKLE